MLGLASRAQPGTIGNALQIEIMNLLRRNTMTQNATQRGQRADRLTKKLIRPFSGEVPETELLIHGLYRLEIR